MDNAKNEKPPVCRILLLTQDASDVRLIGSMMETLRTTMNFTVTPAAGLQEATELIAREPQDVALLDFHFPDAAGLPGIDRFRRAAPGVPVIALADSARDCTPALAAQHGAQDLLIKSHVDPNMLGRAVRYAAERRRFREALRSRLDKFVHFQGVLLDLSRRDAADADATFRRICEAASATLDVDRVGIWLLNPDHTELVSACAYTRSRNSFEKGERIQAREYPRYFAALEETRVVATTHSDQDPRTSEFVESYLKPHGITSMMDVPIRLHGYLVGVICHEHVGPPREWPLEEQDFGSSVADMAALALEATERRQAQEALREERNFSNAVLESTGMMVVVLDPGGRIVRMNRAACHLTGWSIAEAQGKLFWELLTPPENVETVREILAKPPSDATANQHEHSWITRQGARPRVAWSATPIVGTDGALRNCVVTGMDITERKALEEQLIHDAFHDALTGLPNRALFLDRLGQSLRASLRRKEHRFAVLFVDMDRFKLVNDSLGHMQGDQFLGEVSRRMEKCVRPCDTVARFGGDEFTILLEDIKDNADPAQVAERIHAALKEPVRLSGQEVFTTASIGIALSDTGYEQPEDVLRDADIAMYRAKARGGAGHEVFDRSMHSRVVTTLKTESELRRAIERQEFEVHYQPVVSVHNAKLSGFEALVRWNHPKRGLVPPIEFIRSCEETGIIIDLDRYVLREACRQLKDWRTRFPALGKLGMSVNLSVKQFGRPDLGDFVRSAIKDANLEASALGLEITESVLLENTSMATLQLEEIRKTGARLYLDDFGTGYSSLSYLHRFPVDALKIDRSFVGGIKAGGGGREIIKTILSLAQNLDLTVIAEGVETSHQHQALRDLRCQYAQGFMFSKPLSAKDTERLLVSGGIPGDGKPKPGA